MSYQSFEQVLQKCHKEEKEFWRGLSYNNDRSDET